MTGAAVEIETRLRNDAALKAIADLKGAMTRGFSEATNSAKNSVAGLGKSIGEEFGKMASVAGIATLAYGALQTGISAVVNVMRESISAAMEAEETELRLARTLQLRGDATTGALGSLQAFNSALERTTSLDGDALAGVQSTLSAMGVATSDLKNATLAAIGLSEQFGVELPAAAKDVGTALVENREVLRKYGVDAKSAEEVIARFAPSAQLAADRLELLSGKLANNATAWGGLSEAWGKVFTQSDAIKGAVDGISGSVRSLTSALESLQPHITRTFDGMVRVLGSALPGRSLLDLITNADLNYSSPIIDVEKGGVATQNRRDQAPLIYTEAEDQTAAIAAAAAARESDMDAALARLATDTADLKALDLARLDGQRLAIEAENTLRSYRDELARNAAANVERMRDEEFAAAYEATWARIDLAKEEAKEDEKRLDEKRAYWGQLTGLAVLGTSTIIGSLIAGAVAGEKINWGGLFGGLLVSLGQAALSMGTMGLAAAALGTVATWLAPATGGPAGVGASLALIAAGAGAIAAGTALGGSGGGAGAVGAVGRGGVGPVATSGVGGPSSVGTPRGFQAAPTAAPQATVINIAFSGLMAGSERGLAREIGRVLRAGGTLATGG